MQFVRQSKYRHVYTKPFKKEKCLDGVRISKISWDSQFASVNRKFMAVIVEGAGGPFMVFPIDKAGRLEKDYPIVDAHRGACLDVAWCPFNENVIASCSEDTTVKVWMIPDGPMRRNMSEPVVELLGHQKRVTNVVWHPVASNVLLTAGADNKILLWNVGTGELLVEIAGHPDLIWSVSFSWCGSRIVTTCKDKMIRVIDPRSGEIIRQGHGHEGMKPMRAVFTKEGRIFTTGFTKRSERQYTLRDEDAIDDPIVSEELDTSNGVLYPLHDYDTGLMFLVGKGDCAIRFYEINDEAPYVHYIDMHTSSDPQRGMAFMPKLGLNVHENEISRVYKFTNKGFVEVLPFFVPRKSDLFQDDLYPPTPGPVPALTCESWMKGEDAEPLLVDVRPTQGHGSAAQTKRVVAARTTNILATQMGGGGAQHSAAADAEDAELAARIARVQRELEEKKQQAATASMRLAQTAPKERYSEPTPRASDGIVLTGGVRRSQAALNDDKPVGPTSTEERTRWEQRNARLGLANTTPASSHAPSEPSPPAARAPRQSARQDSITSSVSTLGPSVSRQGSEQPPASGVTSHRGEPIDWATLVDDVHKMKLIIRKHERRIRFLEEMLEDKNKDDDLGI